MPLLIIAGILIFLPLIWAFVMFVFLPFMAIAIPVAMLCAPFVILFLHFTLPQKNTDPNLKTFDEAYEDARRFVNEN